MQPRSPILRDSLLIVLAYMAVRCGVYAVLPVHTDAEWSRRDLFMCLPRLATFAALARCNRHRWGNAVPFDFVVRGRGLLLPALLLVGAEVLRTFLFAGGNPWPWGLALVGIAATVPVVLFEEYAFRGGLHQGLVARFGTATALFLGAALFTLFHIQAPAVVGWPAIFLFGLTWAGLRQRGLGLGWTALIHFIVDSLYFARGVFPPFWSGANGVYLFLLLVGAALAWPRGSLTPRAPRPASPA
ncbi:CAAX protease self-immunity [Verrucomicrobium sp. GAS474]|uniref:CPBP family intramembrane glutamic endopeptidase n=1 Tax=Verrucomicrobium sp. GAS474 TaxID=1882831 RepID=UPI00087B6E39|nr:CPBP family intramembrane glutamic endopeptidase [Verrucomicrobium sp. GAS474]SDT95873.1 CAAX protease self-immunity [Verrucomicrobium sp. GAS474]